MLDWLFSHSDLVTAVLGSLAILCVLVGYVGSLLYPSTFIERPKRKLFWTELREVFSRRGMIAFHLLIIVLVILIGVMTAHSRPEKRGEIVPALGTVLLALGACVVSAWRKQTGRFLYRNVDFISAFVSAIVATGIFLYYMIFNDAWMPLAVANTISVIAFLILLAIKRPWRAIESWFDGLCRLGLIFLVAMIVWVVTVILKNR